MPKKYLTIEDLISFCQQSNLTNFSAKEADGPIIIQSFGKIESSDNAMMGLTACTLQACHTELNNNKSFISEDVMNNALSSFYNRPILAFIHQTEEGEWNFWDHRMTIEEDYNGEARVEYLEQPIGVIPESGDARLEYDKEKGKTYVVVNGLLYDDYGNRAVDIINNNGGEVTVSVEIAINQMSYNVKEDYLNIEDMVFMGVTCLGKTPTGEIVKPGMEGSNLKLDNFSEKENSMFSENYQSKLVEVLDKLNITLSNLNNVNFSQEGGDADMDKFNELLEQYGFTAEELDFDYEGMTTEELEAAFEEYACKKKKKCSEEDNDPEATENEACKKKKKCEEEGNGEPEEEEPVATEDEACKKKKKCSLDADGNMTVSFEISHEDIRSALFNLLGTYEEQDAEWYWISNVYDDYFVYENWSGDKLYKQAYEVDGDNVSFSGDRQQVFKMILTESEKIAIEKMRDDYSALESKYNELKEFKDNYEASVAQAEKDAIFESAEYAEIKDSDEFKALITDADKYSVDELKVKADLLFAASMKKKFSFEPEKKNSVGINLNAKPNKKKEAYAGLFADK